MRDIVLTAIFFGVLPLVFSRPYVGIYIWSWMGLMNPHRLTYGFAYDFPFAQIVAIVIFVSVLKSRQPIRVPWTRETVLLLIFILWMLFTTIFALNTDGAWEQWGKIWKIQLMIFVTLMLIDTKQKLNWLIWVIVLSLGLYGVKGGIFTIATGGVYNVQGPAGSFIGGNNEIGLALIMTIPLMRYLQLQAKSIWIHQGMAVAMFFTGIAAIGSQSRGALLGMTVMGIFLWLKSRNKFFIMLSIVVVIGAVVAIMPQSWYDRMSTIESFETDKSAMTRINSWMMAYNIATDRVTGGGFETFFLPAFRKYAPIEGGAADAHSIYFEILGEHGFIGLAMFLLLAWFAWNTGNRIRRSTGKRPETKWAADLASMIQVSMIGYAASGAFLGLAYFDLYYTLIAVMVICKLVSMEELERLDVAPVTTGYRKIEPGRHSMQKTGALTRNQ